MKKALVFICILVMTACDSAQNNTELNESEHDIEIPSAVAATCAKKFPNVKDLHWEQEHGNYEAEFKIDRMDFSIVFDQSGTIIEEEIEIKINELPEAALDYIKAHYKGKPIVEASKISTSAQTIEYEAEVAGEDLIFDSNGKFISLY